MIDNPDIYKAANFLVQQYGEDAPIRAAQRADDMLEEGDLHTIFSLILYSVIIIHILVDCGLCCKFC